jgi:hypothetical protein
MKRRRPYRLTSHHLRNVTIRMSRPLLFRIGQVADELGCTRTEFVRRAVVKDLEAHAAERRR